MKIAVLGLWHLGSVTAACAAAAGHTVAGYDPDVSVVSGLQSGVPPIAEPGLADLVVAGLRAGTLRIVNRAQDAVVGADVVWICFDTPVDDDDRADVAFVVREIEAALPFVADGAVVLSSSQLPVGTMSRVRQAFLALGTGRDVSFACSPENLRLGKAIDVFQNPDRIVVGADDDRARERLRALFAPITDRLEWMSIESAEMTKHAINAFLATSVTFINELATLCEQTGADAKEVERGLKTERRIGPGAYLAPGGAVAGGTLARDVMFLRALGRDADRSTPLLDGVLASNTAHRRWAERRLRAELGSLGSARIAVWGLTYKPGTDTLRRSGAVELCQWLLRGGAVVRVHDPAVTMLPAELEGVIRADTPLDAADGADAVVVATEWPEYRRASPDELAARVARRLVLDANRFLDGTIGRDPRFRLVSVGRAGS